MGHMTSGLGGLAPFFRRFLPLLNGYTPFFLPYFGHFWPPVNGFLPSPSGWACSDFTNASLLSTQKKKMRWPRNMEFVIGCGSMTVSLLEKELTGR